MSFEIHFADAPLGHEIRGVDLSRPIPPEDFRQVEEAYDRYGVVLFRDQKLDPDQQIAFSKQFGPLDRYVLDKYNLKTHPEIFVVSNVVENGVAIGLGDAGQYWHTDMWVKPVPPRGSMLHALEVPHDAQGQPVGDTCFSSMAAAYDALPEALRETIEHRSAVYSSKRFIDFRIAATPVDPKTGTISESARAGMEERARNIVPEITHPLVKPHPRTGRKCIYFSEGAIDHIEGLPRAESDRALYALRDHVLSPQFIYRHRWRVGDVVIWDNTSCIHKAINDYALPQRRRMHRTTLASNPRAWA